MDMIPVKLIVTPVCQLLGMFIDNHKKISSPNVNNNNSNLDGLQM